MQGGVLLGVNGKLALVEASPGWTWFVVAGFRGGLAEE